MRAQLIRFAAVWPLTALSTSAIAQWLGSDDAAIERRSRLLGEMRSVVSAPFLGRLEAGGQPWQTTCKWGISASISEGAARKLATPVACAAEQAKLKLELETQGYVSQAGAIKRRGVADVLLSATRKQSAADVEIAFTGSVTLPSRSDTGSEHADLAAGLAMVLPNIGEVSPNLGYELTRNGNVVEAGGRSTQRILLGLSSEWLPKCEAALEWARSTVRHAAGSNTLTLRQSFPIPLVAGLAGSIVAIRNDGDWNERLKVAWSREF